MTSEQINLMFPGQFFNTVIFIGYYLNQCLFKEHSKINWMYLLSDLIFIVVWLAMLKVGIQLHVMLLFVLML